MLLLAEEGCDPVMTVMCSISHWRFHVGLLHRVVLNASKKSNAIRRAYYYERVTCISALMDLSAADVNPAVGLKACWSEKMLLRQNWIKIPSSDNLLQGSAHDRNRMIDIGWYNRLQWSVSIPLGLVLRSSFSSLMVHTSCWAADNNMYLQVHNSQSECCDWSAQEPWRTFRRVNSVFIEGQLFNTSESPTFLFSVYPQPSK